ncbi:hypothetical protein [Streptomyces abikoensis]|uniref:Uncharacterized protein n=1 Tax=Streptomyces abikoensis TaxID=97398 RepID=A0ABW7T838_9ACTN
MSPYSATLGDLLAQNAITNGARTELRTSDPEAGLRLTIHQSDGSALTFQRAPGGAATDWRVADLESPSGGCAFDEPVTDGWGRALDRLAQGHLNP